MSIRRRAARTILAAGAVFVAAACLAPASTFARTAQSAADPALSPLLAELAAPAVSAQPPSRQAEIVGVPAHGPASLQREGDRLLLRVRFEEGAIERLPRLREAGGEVEDASRRYQLVTVSAPPSELRGIAAVPEVASVAPIREPFISETTLSVAGEGPCEGGSVISEGRGQLRVDQARGEFGLRGSGLTVGVLSDTYDRSGEALTHAQQDTVSGDLPGPAGSCSDQQEAVRVLQEGPSEEATDEGRAMLQLVHDLAPHAGLAFATAFISEQGFAQNIERLARPVSAGGADADVIVDDVSYFEEPFFQDGPVAAAVRKVSAEGVAYLSAAGNDNLLDSGGRDIGSWEAPAFRDAGVCPTAIGGVGAIHCMDFNPLAGTDSTYGIVVEPEEPLNVDLQWAEPWEGVEADLDAYLLDAAGNTILAESVEDNIQGQQPVEVLSWENPSTSPREVQVAINRCVGTCNPQASLLAQPRLKFILLENGGGVESVEYPLSAGGDVVGPTVYGHAGAAAAMTVGAIRFNSTSAPEPYSSRGPVTHYFEPVTGTEAADPLGSAEVVPKPDFLATDCGATTFFASSVGGVWRFCGTSAAAPHAAAIAALIAQGEPGASPAEIDAAMSGSAAAVGSFGADAVGAGLLRADGALSLAGVQPTTEDPPSTSTAPLAGEPTPPQPALSAPQAPKAAAVAPATALRRRPPKLVRTRRRSVRLVFRFAADQRGASFLCRIDDGGYRACSARLIRRFALGQHRLAVKAVGPTGLADPTPATYRFRVVPLA
jgi:subtilisin family serine protease